MLGGIGGGLEEIGEFDSLIQTLGINNPDILQASPYTALLLKA